MKIAILILCLLFPVSAIAAPFLVCDPQAGVSYYEITGLGTITTSTPATDGSLHQDLAGLTAGQYSITVAACDDLWGCSATVPFAFTKPSLGTPGNVKILKQ